MERAAMKPSTPSTFRSRTAAEDGKIEFSPPTRLRRAVFGVSPEQAVFLLFSIAVLLAGDAMTVADGGEMIVTIGANA